MHILQQYANNWSWKYTHQSAGWLSTSFYVCLTPERMFSESPGLLPQYTNRQVRFISEMDWRNDCVCAYCLCHMSLWWTDNLSYHLKASRSHLLRTLNRKAGITLMMMIMWSSSHCFLFHNCSCQKFSVSSDNDTVQHVPFN